jgi:hypothetical protein
MHQEKDADREDEDERADEETEVKVKITNEPVKSSSHSASILSEAERCRKSSAKKDVVRRYRLGMAGLYKLKGGDVSFCLAFALQSYRITP